MIEGDAIDNVWFATRYRTQSPVAEKHLKLASVAYADNAKAEMHLALATAVAPNNPVVKVGEYRYYFYKGRLEEALRVATECMRVVAGELGLPLQWQSVEPQHADFGEDEPAHRFYLFCLKAYAYLLLRLNHMDEGREAVDKLLQLDPANKVGGRVLLDVLERIGKDDYDD
jgi:tetratricopeptide (TPR) repeat protein